VATATEAVDDYLADIDPASWTWAAYLLRYSTAQLTTDRARRSLCRVDPLLFAIIYLRHHLSCDETGGQISISQFHIDLCRSARQWIRRDIGPAECRDAWVAPRGSGKSTWAFLILPLWALAYRHRKYIAAFANTATQAEGHLASLKRELDENSRLRRDFPKLCAAKRRPNGMPVADRQDVYIAASGVAFTARGIDSSTLGAKIGEQRPDEIILDDIEPDASNYSEHEKEKRLATVRNALMPMNLNAVLWFVGTTTMDGSIIHDLVRQATDPDSPQWPREEKVRVHYYHAIIDQPDGTRVSLWPQRWTIAYLISIEGTDSFQLNMANQPTGNGGWWQPGDIRYDSRPAYARVVMVIDGAVTAKPTSDETGVAIVGLDLNDRKLFVLEAIGLRLTGEPRRARIIELILEYDVDYVLVEANQGGDLWYMELNNLPVRMRTFTQKEPKPVRIKRCLAAYQRRGGRVAHAKPLPALEKQQRAYPNVLHEDILDAASAGVEHLAAIILKSADARRDKALVHQFSYR
jgi:hypothetical protein